MIPIYKKYYIPVYMKFILAHFFSICWSIFSIYISIPWLKDLEKILNFPMALFIIAGIAYIPGYFNVFMVISLLLDRQPPFKESLSNKKVSILIAAKNEQNKIENTLKYIKKQDYKGKINIILVDNNSNDHTISIAKKAAKKYNLSMTVIEEQKTGKFHALNTGIHYVTTDFVITLDADTILHPSAVRYLVSRMESSPKEVAAVAGCVLVRNSRDNLLTKIQEWDYFLGIASIKRLQGLYQGTLVAQGAYSIYKTNVIKELGGWPDAIGEDIVLTWSFLKNNLKCYFEPLAVAFTDVPTTLSSFAKQRSRWARGMIEALKITKPWEQPEKFVKYLTGVNLFIPYLDFTFTLCWIPGLILAFFGYYFIVGPMTLLVIPLTLVSYLFLYKYQKFVFKNLNLQIRKNFIGFIFFVLFYQMIMSPISLLGYIQELFKLKRIWK